MSRTFSANRLSFDSLKVFTRCGLSSCAFQMRCTLVWLRPLAAAISRMLQCVPAGGFSCRVLSTTCLIVSALSGGLRPGRLASRRSPTVPAARWRCCQRLTVTLLLPTNRAIAITPCRSADNSTIRARQTTFCGVFRPETHPSSVTRSAGDSQRHASVFFIPQDSHSLAKLGT